MKVFVNVCIVATNMMRENAIFISSKLGLLGNAVKIYKTFAGVITSLTLSSYLLSTDIYFSTLKLDLFPPMYLFNIFNSRKSIWITLFDKIGKRNIQEWNLGQGKYQSSAIQ